MIYGVVILVLYFDWASDADGEAFEVRTKLGAIALTNVPAD